MLLECFMIQAVEASFPLPAWRPDFNDPSVDGPFLRAIKAAYKAHKWVQDHAEEFPVTLSRSPPSPPPKSLKDMVESETSKNGWSLFSKRKNDGKDRGG